MKGGNEGSTGDEQTAIAKTHYEDKTTHKRATFAHLLGLSVKLWKTFPTRVQGDVNNTNTKQSTKKKKKKHTSYHRSESKWELIVNLSDFKASEGEGNSMNIRKRL